MVVFALPRSVKPQRYCGKCLLLSLAANMRLLHTFCILPELSEPDLNKCNDWTIISSAEDSVKQNISNPSLVFDSKHARNPKTNCRALLEAMGVLCKSTV